MSRKSMRPAGYEITGRWDGEARLSTTKPRTRGTTSDDSPQAPDHGRHGTGSGRPDSFRVQRRPR
jgi:hypothetical protein